MAQTTQRVPFRLIHMPCCGQLLCWVNPRLPNHCPECGKYVFKDIRACVVLLDENAWLKTETGPAQLVPILPQPAHKDVTG